MPKINVLPTDLVNRIAAGECIERPASVVKELVENALDAGATRVDLLIHDGGRALIQVTDDGCGMTSEDLALCVQPHATSKIASDEDLFSIHTMGFRGEALPSIGSVSRLEITTRTAESDLAHTLKIDGGQIGRIVPDQATVGTRVAVRDLFFNVPARRKFLKTNQTETSHITEQLARIALAHPEVSFTLTTEKRRLHNLPATDSPRQRIGDFYGPEMAESLLPVRREGRGLRVEGLVAPPAQSRSSSKWEYVFVNGRYVRDRFIGHAVKSAYRSLIDPSRYPVVFLFLTVDPGQLDVNVHPTKIEVRWQDSNQVHSHVLATLREKFLSTNLDHNLRTQHTTREADQERVREALTDFLQSAPRTYQPRLAPTAPIRVGGDEHAAPRSDRVQHAPTAPTGASPPPTSTAAPEPSHEAALGKPVIRALQVHNRYIVAETEDGVMLIDQHALHERILYEQFRARLTSAPLESQRLLLAESVSVAPDRIAALEQHADLLSRLGIELTAGGPQSVTLHAFPTLLGKVDRAKFVTDLLDRLVEVGQRYDAETVLHELLDMMACKAAVKFGDPLTPDEVTALLELRLMAERSSHCPHGRPTTLHLTLADLERQFKRR